jgi:hypothetical protein
MKKRFPRKEKRLELRTIFDENKGIPDDFLFDNSYFTDFNLKLTTAQPNQKNKFSNLNYATLDDDDKITFDLRTIRNIIIKQNTPEDGHSVVFEVFNRLNSGGVNLKPQEIRTSLFHSDFYDMLYKVNLEKTWRAVTPSSSPNLHMRDVEIILRGFALLIEKDHYKPSMTKFLNQFSYKAKSFPKENITYLEELFKAFLSSIPVDGFKLFFSTTGRFNISVYESIFVASCIDAFNAKNLLTKPIDLEKVSALKRDAEFVEATQSDTASEKNVKLRLDKALQII